MLMAGEVGLTGSSFTDVGETIRRVAGAKPLAPSWNENQTIQLIMAIPPRKTITVLKVFQVGSRTAWSNSNDWGSRCTLNVIRPRAPGGGAAGTTVFCAVAMSPPTERPGR